MAVYCSGRGWPVCSAEELVLLHAVVFHVVMNMLPSFFMSFFFILFFLRLLPLFGFRFALAHIVFFLV